MGIMESISGVLKGKKAAPGTRTTITMDKSVLLPKVKQAELFRTVPEDTLALMLDHMESVAVKSGDVIIREGDEGDYYYLLVTGSAQVTRRLHNESNPQPVADLNEPIGFGEEALISNAKRNASIVMTTDGTVLRLSKDAFNDFVKEALVTWVPPLEAQKKIAEGARWVDVRDPLSAKESHLHGAVSMPMEDLRNRSGELDNSTFYICYCENGRLSSTAAFLLRQRGVTVGVLRGGLQSLRRAGIA